jgi:hypothetical protein
MDKDLQGKVILLTGEYFHDRKVARTAALARDDALVAKLWEFSEKRCAVSA